MRAVTVPKLVVGLFAVAALVAPPAGAEASPPSTGEAMAKLAPFAGLWRAVATVYPRGNSPASVDIEHRIEPILGGTYLRWEAMPSGDLLPSFVLMITWSPKEQAYRQIYFYSGTALQVVEMGRFDEATGEYQTTGRIEGGAGGRAYLVRSSTKLEADGSMSFRNWGRYEGEADEVLDMEAKFVRGR